MFCGWWFDHVLCMRDPAAFKIFLSIFIKILTCNMIFVFLMPKNFQFEVLFHRKSAQEAPRAYSTT
jgi:hypothetical protein